MTADVGGVGFETSDTSRLRGRPGRSRVGRRPAPCFASAHPRSTRRSCKRRYRAYSRDALYPSIESCRASGPSEQGLSSGEQQFAERCLPRSQSRRAPSAIARRSGRRRLAGRSQLDRSILFANGCEPDRCPGFPRRETVQPCFLADTCGSGPGSPGSINSNDSGLGGSMHRAGRSVC